MAYGLLALVIIGGLALSLALTGGLVWLVCWAFGLTFTWKLVVGVWAVTAIVRSTFYYNKKEK